MLLWWCHWLWILNFYSFFFGIFTVLIQNLRNFWKTANCMIFLKYLVHVNRVLILRVQWNFKYTQISISNRLNYLLSWLTRISLLFLQLNINSLVSNVQFNYTRESVKDGRNIKRQNRDWKQKCFTVSHTFFLSFHTFSLFFILSILIYRVVTVCMYCASRLSH